MIRLTTDYTHPPPTLPILNWWRVCRNKVRDTQGSQKVVEAEQTKSDQKIIWESPQSI